MRGHFTFILVFLAAALLIELAFLRAAASPANLSGAVALERAFGVEMNAKECVLEAARQGGEAGFSAYDLSHDLGSCIHCGDHYCAPMTPAGPPPNVCDAALCSKCFREGDARAASEAGASAALGLLASAGMEGDFTVNVRDAGGGAPAAPEGVLQKDASAKNGMRLGLARFRKDVIVRARSDKLGVSLSGKVPQGTVVRYGTGGD
jgi:hypothetical protein